MRNKDGHIIKYIKLKTGRYVLLGAKFLLNKVFINKLPKFINNLKNK